MTKMKWVKGMIPYDIVGGGDQNCQNVDNVIYALTAVVKSLFERKGPKWIY